MTESTLSAEQLAVYRATAKQRRERDRAAEQARRVLAWEAAHEAAKLLRNDYRVTRVVVFGSLVHDGRFTRWSDVDIAVWGLDERDSLNALGAVMDLPTDIRVSLVDVATCTPALLAAIERDGIDL